MARNVLLRQAFLLQKSLTRNFGISSVCYQKAAGNLDPIQKLFVEKLKEYSQKSKLVLDAIVVNGLGVHIIMSMSPSLFIIYF